MGLDEAELFVQWNGWYVDIRKLKLVEEDKDILNDKISRLYIGL